MSLGNADDYVESQGLMLINNHPSANRHYPFTPYICQEFNCSHGSLLVQVIQL